MDAGQEDPVMEAEWKRLIFARESGALDAAGHERLEQLVLQDPAARRFYARHLLQTAHLRAWASATSAERQTAGERGGGIGPVILQPAETTTQSSCAPLLGFLQRLPAAIHPVRHPIWFLTAATCLTSIFWLVVMAVISPRGEQAFHPRLPGGAVAHTRFDAMIIRAQDAVWAEDSPSPQVGYALPLERSWMLREGLVQLLFGDGALVVLEGPARFQIDSAGSMSIEQGKMLARAEGRARGFVVRTPVVRLDDLGTEFGLEVAELERETELQVFEGSVQASPGDVRQVPAGYLLRAGDAILFGHTPQHGFYAKEKMMNRNAYLLLASVMLMPVVDGVTTPRTAEALPISLDMVTVGNINNPNDVHGDGFGAVNEEYRIGAYLVTNDQYATFLNAVAANDPFSLYNTNMGSNIRGGITRSGSPGTYTYAAKENMGNKPVNFVSFWDAARFANWLHNGQGAADTENGAYTLTAGSISSNTVDRNTGAKFFLPTENEWYKAAYYDASLNSGLGGYWDYATKSNFGTPPTLAAADAFGNISNPGVNVANYNLGADWNSQNGNVTTVGSAGNSSYYGTYDQTGNVWEWNETIVDTTKRGLRGGSWSDNSTFVSALFRFSDAGSAENIGYGFRIAGALLLEEPPTESEMGAIPEPATGGVLGMGCLLALALARRRIVKSSLSTAP